MKQPKVDTPFAGSWADRMQKLHQGDAAENAEMKRLAEAHRQKNDPFANAVVLRTISLEEYRTLGKA